MLQKESKISLEQFNFKKSTSEKNGAKSLFSIIMMRYGLFKGSVLILIGYITCINLIMLSWLLGMWAADYLFYKMVAVNPLL